MPPTITWENRAQYPSQAKRQIAWDGLVGLWSMLERGGDTVYDLSGQGNSLAAVGSPAGFEADYLKGPFTSSNYWSAGTSVNMAGWTGISVVCWCKFDGAGSDEDALISNWDTPKASFLLRVDPTVSDQIEAYLVREPNTTVNIATSDLVVPTNEWCQIALTAESGGNLQAYLNSTVSSDVAAMSSAMDATASGNLYVGRTPHNTTEAWGGDIGYIAIYNRALAPAEIAQWHALGLAYPLARRDMAALFYVPPVGGDIVVSRRRIEAA